VKHTSYNPQHIPLPNGADGLWLSQIMFVIKDEEANKTTSQRK
jgi:hypothetical protein